MHNPRLILAKDLTVTGMSPHLITSSANRSSFAYTFRQGICLERIRSLFGYPTYLGNSRLGLSRANCHRWVVAHSQSSVLAFCSRKYHICLRRRSAASRTDLRSHDL